MMKQLTALILILAIANPFCCCFGASAPSTDETEHQPQRSSCCHQPVDNPTDEEPSNGGSCKNCSCKKAAVKADHNGLDVAHINVLKSLVLLSEHSDLLLTFVTTSGERIGFVMRPPPSPGLRLHKVYSVYRT